MFTKTCMTHKLPLHCKLSTTTQRCCWILIGRPTGVLTQVLGLQRFWRDMVVIRNHQRQLLFMQLQQFAQKRGNRVVRIAGSYFGTNVVHDSYSLETTKGDCILSF